MTELETIARAKMYLEKLANGINPLDDCPVPDDDVIQNVRLSRCFFYVSDLLRQVIENGGIQAPAPAGSRKQPFALTQEQRSRYPFSPEPVTVTVLAQRINDLTEGCAVTRLKTTAITSWLQSLNMLEEIELPGGHHHRQATQRGCSIGLANVERTTYTGTYTAVEYSEAAQHFVLDNLEAIVQYAQQVKEAENRPWTAEEDQTLRQLFLEGSSPAEAARVLHRRAASVRSRIKNLRLDPEDIG